MAPAPRSSSTSAAAAIASTSASTSSSGRSDGARHERPPAGAALPPQRVERIDGEEADAQAESHGVPVELGVIEHQPHAQAGENPGGHQQAVAAAERPPGE